MKKTLGLIFGFLVVASAAFATKGEAKKASYEINTKESKVYWTGKKITGSAHTGYISIGNGMISVEGGAVVGGEVNIDLNTIVCTDLENEEYNQKLVGHLKGEDFFEVGKFPNAKFEIVSISGIGDKSDVIGKLTMKGKTHEIAFPAIISVMGNKVTAQGTASVDRIKWGVEYGSGSIFKELGDKAINDEFEIKFDLVANTSDLNLSKK